MRLSESCICLKTPGCHFPRAHHQPLSSILFPRPAPVQPLQRGTPSAQSPNPSRIPGWDWECRISPQICCSVFCDHPCMVSNLMPPKILWESHASVNTPGIRSRATISMYEVVVRATQVERICTKSHILPNQTILCGVGVCWGSDC